MKKTKPMFRPTRKAGEYIFFNGEKEVKPEFSNIFRISDEDAIQLTVRQLRKGICLIIPCKSNDFCYEAVIRRRMGTNFSVSLDFSEEMIAALSGNDQKARFTDLSSQMMFVKKHVIRGGCRVPGGICYDTCADSLEDLLEHTEHVVSELIQSLFKES